MPKIIPFPKTDAQSVDAFLRQSIEILLENKVYSLLIAGKCENGEVITGYYECDFGQRQEICGHIQCDIIDQMIRANPDRY